MLVWKGSFVLINLVVNHIQIYSISSLKIPFKVWKLIVKIKRNFFKGEVKGEIKVSWVMWYIVCKPKRNHGLGVCNLYLVNLAFLGKYRWRMVLYSPSLWHEILITRYGIHVVFSSTLRYVFPWWKGISILSVDPTTWSS